MIKIKHMILIRNISMIIIKMAIIINIMTKIINMTVSKSLFIF